eukprot:gnl/TRDRNA2_/TRDRNA2_195576_c0_seq1.p1 gnl/TRDRNA2_/TRDRNA2_195576_c0~~gnl/TRDRNA2_/TRDRNA2_195576_c0_seq1.p1  ORF type:complete len:168 (+),score=17.64 gnl/TRDRNA2_/TRDRNA2_195576_c0_seq1:56-559(+)
MAMSMWALRKQCPITMSLCAAGANRFAAGLIGQPRTFCTGEGDARSSPNSPGAGGEDPEDAWVSAVKKPRHYQPEDGELQRQHRWKSRCPFTVHRTGSDNLPVYVYKRNNRNHIVTVVRKVRGNEEEFRRELEYLCRCRVSIGKSGYLEIPGNHRRAVKAYLSSIGY